jgi:hypothetical protein
MVYNRTLVTERHPSSHTEAATTGPLYLVTAEDRLQHHGFYIYIGKKLPDP